MRKMPALARMGVDEIYLGKKQKFISVVSNLETGEPLWFGQERKKETLDEFFTSQLSSRQRMRLTAACVDMWEPFRLSIEQWSPNCRIVYDKFHIMQHANRAIDEVRRAEFFRKGPRMRGLVKRQNRWLLLTRWLNLSNAKRQELNRLFALNRKDVQSLSAEGKPGSPVELTIRRSHDPILAELDRSASMAAAGAIPKARPDADRSC